jgi:hypothetical protein
MKRSVKFEGRPPTSKALRRSGNSKQIRSSKTRLSVDMRTPWLVASSPLPSPPLEERENIWRVPSQRELVNNFGADVRPLTSAVTKFAKPRRFGFRVLNLIRVSDFEFRIFTSCK